MKKKILKELYKKCEKCKGHSYLTEGGFYLCTMCEHKEYVNENGEVELRTYQISL